MQQKEEEGFASLFKVIVITSKSTEQSQHLCSVSVILLNVVTCAWTFLSTVSLNHAAWKGDVKLSRKKDINLRKSE